MHLIIRYSKGNDWTSVTSVLPYFSYYTGMSLLTFFEKKAA